MKEFLLKNKRLVIIFLLILAILFGLFYSLRQSAVKTIKNEKEYIETVVPWLDSIGDDYQPQDIASVRDELLYLKSRDKSIGDAHMNLFLAFDVWQQYLKTKDPVLENQIEGFLQEADEKMPALDPSIKRLEIILSKDV